MQFKVTGLAIIGALWMVLAPESFAHQAADDLPNVLPPVRTTDCSVSAQTPGCDAAQLVGAPRADSNWPGFIGAQYTFVRQNQSTLRSPYMGPVSLGPEGDIQNTHTIGLYLGWAPLDWAQLYLDTEKFMGAGVSGATGLGGLTNGEVVRQGASGLKKEFYIARGYLRLMLPLGKVLTRVEHAQDQIPGTEAATRFEFKFGRLAAPDDFDRNRYAGSTRTEFMNWSLWDNTAWDYAANTRGYSDGLVIGYISPNWSLKYGVYRMPVFANGQTLESSFHRARGENLELELSPWQSGTIIRLLGYRNIARMGVYRNALAAAAVNMTIPDVVADDQEGRRKYGIGLNVEQPISDDGETGIFLRGGWNDGKTESFAFTEVDRHLSIGGQVSGAHWRRAKDRLGLALVSEDLSAAHRDYLAAGGSGFVLGDGRLNYAHEQIIEAYYRLELSWPASWQPSNSTRFPVRLQLSPDFQYIRNPGYNQDRGPARFWALRLHVEY